MVKISKEIDSKGVNDLIGTGKKILKLIYFFMIIALIIGGIFIGQQLFIFDFIFNIIKVLSPLFIGFIIAWLFNPLVNKLNNKKVPRLLGTFIIYVGILIFLFLFIGLFIPIIYEQIQDFIKMVPGLVATITEFADKILETLGASGMNTNELETSLTNYFVTLGEDLASAIPQNAFSVLGSIFSGVVTGVLSFIIGFYMLLDFDNIQKTLIKGVPKKHQTEVVFLLSNIGREVRKVVNGTLLIALMVFICDTIGFSIIGLEAALLIGLFCGITDLIPYIGPYIGGGVAVLVGYSQGPVVGTGVLIIALIVQLLENYVLQPVVMGKAASLHPTVIIGGLLIFGYFFGIVGMIFATPVLAILKVIYQFFDEKYNLLGNNTVKKIKISKNQI